MEFNFSDSKVFTEKEKKYYTTVSGEKIDLTWKPAIVDRIYKEYTDTLFEIQKLYPKQLATLEKAKNEGFKPEDIEFIQAFSYKVDEYRNKFYQIMIAACKANGKEVTSDWIDQMLLTEEKDLILQIIMDTHHGQFGLKKK